MSQRSPGSGEAGLTGATVDGKYVVGAPIGEGRAGTVYAATTADGRSIVLKVLRPSLSRSRMHVERFLESARQTAAVRHPGVVEILEIGRIPDHSVYFAMERLQGHTVRELLSGRPVPWARARPIALGVCEALAHAHAARTFHGALDAHRCWVVHPASPGADPTVRITDFGIAGEGSGPEIWPADAPYRAPERRQGEPSSPRGDVFAIGGLVFELLTGRPPKAGERPEPPSGPALPDELLDAIHKAISRDPSRRFVDADALGRTLASVDAAGHVSPVAPPVASVDTRAPPGRHVGPPTIAMATPDEEDVTMVRTDRRPSGSWPAADLPTLAAAAAHASAARAPGTPTASPRPSGSPPRRAVPGPTHPTPPPMLAVTTPPPASGPASPGAFSGPASPSRPAPRPFTPQESEPEDQTSVLSGGFRFQPTEQTSILPAPRLPDSGPLPAPVSPPVEVDVGGEFTAVVEYRPPVSGGASSGDTGVHAITRQPPGAPREETAILDLNGTTGVPRDLATTTAILEVPALPVMREQTQMFGMDSDGVPQPASAGTSMTAVIEGPFEEITSGSVIVSSPDAHAAPTSSPGPQPARSPAPGTAPGPAFARPHVPAAPVGVATPGYPPVAAHPPSGAHLPGMHLGAGAQAGSGAHPMTGAHPSTTGHVPTGAHASVGYPPSHPHAASGAYPASRPPAHGSYPAGAAMTPSSGGYPSSPASSGPKRTAKRSDHGMVVGVALGILLAVAILGGGVVAGLWVASQ